MVIDFIRIVIDFILTKCDTIRISISLKYSISPIEYLLCTIFCRIIGNIFSKNQP